MKTRGLYQTLEQTTETTMTPSKVDLHTFINVKGYSDAIEHRIQIFLENQLSEKTMEEWENIYSQSMNRKTK